MQVPWNHVNYTPPANLPRLAHQPPIALEPWETKAPVRCRSVTKISKTSLFPGPALDPHVGSARDQTSGVSVSQSRWLARYLIVRPWQPPLNHLLSAVVAAAGKEGSPVTPRLNDVGRSSQQLCVAGDSTFGAICPTRPTRTCHGRARTVELSTERWPLITVTTESP